MLRWRIMSRSEFEGLLAVPPERLTDMQRAARFLYLQRLAFGGKVSGRHFGVDHRTPGRFDVTKLEPLLGDINERLAGVVVENLPYGELIERYDGPETLFYLDPPYWGCERDYGADAFARDDFACLAALLASIEGSFILSLNDTPEVRACVLDFRIAEVETTWTIATAAAGCGKKVIELVLAAAVSR